MHQYGGGNNCDVTKRSIDKLISQIFPTDIDLEAGKEYFIPLSPCSMSFDRDCNSPRYQNWKHRNGGRGEGLQKDYLVEGVNRFVHACSKNFKRPKGVNLKYFNARSIKVVMNALNSFYSNHYQKYQKTNAILFIMIYFYFRWPSILSDSKRQKFEEILTISDCYKSLKAYETLVICFN